MRLQRHIYKLKWKDLEIDLKIDIFKYGNEVDYLLC